MDLLHYRFFLCDSLFLDLASLFSIPILVDHLLHPVNTILPLCALILSAKWKRSKKPWGKIKINLNGLISVTRNSGSSLSNQENFHKLIIRDIDKSMSWLGVVQENLLYVASNMVAWISKHRPWESLEIFWTRNQMWLSIPMVSDESMLDVAPNTMFLAESCSSWYCSLRFVSHDKKMLRIFSKDRSTMKKKPLNRLQWGLKK